MLLAPEAPTSGVFFALKFIIGIFSAHSTFLTRYRVLKSGMYSTRIIRLLDG